MDRNSIQNIKLLAVLSELRYFWISGGSTAAKNITYIYPHQGSAYFGGILCFLGLCQVLRLPIHYELKRRNQTVFSFFGVVNILAGFGIKPKSKR